MNTVIILLIIIVILLIWSAVEQKFFTVTSHTVASDRLPQKMDGISFVVLADLHDMNFGRNNIRLAREIDRLAPDFILVAGDLIDKSRKPYPGNAYKLLEHLAGKYRIYYAYGNHEQKLEKYAQEDLSADKKELYASWNEFKDRLKKLNVIFLDNSYAIYNKENDIIRIYGVSIGEEFFAKRKIPVMKKEYLASLLGNNNTNNNYNNSHNSNNHFKLLIAHNPEHFHEYISWGADLTVSGHLHGGMMRLPGLGGVISPQVKFFPKYYSGCFEDNGRYMIVSRGLGTHSYMPRLFNVPELIHVRLKAKKMER